MQHEFYMQRCIQLASNGLGNVAPNPMVGCVIVHNNSIVGEGFHQFFGSAHAEVNAILSVADKSVLNSATLYVNLEPCSHYGKTPPCTNLIIKSGIKKVVIGCSDPFKEVNGLGIKKLKDSGIEVVCGVMENECKELNMRFFSQHLKQRPYIILKWAQTLDGFIDIERNSNSNFDNWISNNATKQLVHKWRSEEQAILVGTNTVFNDNPFLTTREYPGKSPIRIVIDRELKLPQSLNVFNSDASTIVLNEKVRKIEKNVEYLLIDFSDFFNSFNSEMLNRNIQSLIVEGGKHVLDLFINNNCWDEARIIIGNKTFGKGLTAPIILAKPEKQQIISDNKLLLYLNNG
jgi:diaminohydroxyphosphoribosylaminopyrimidine deaminase/5-amino-6-(5-phosphoribosylamino)uracil reductase